MSGASTRLRGPFGATFPSRAGEGRAPLLHEVSRSGEGDGRRPPDGVRKAGRGNQATRPSDACCCHAEAARGLTMRRQAAVARPRKPSPIIAQIEGSGAAMSNLKALCDQKALNDQRRSLFRATSGRPSPFARFAALASRERLGTAVRRGARRDPLRPRDEARVASALGGGRVDGADQRSSRYFIVRRSRKSGPATNLNVDFL